MRKAREGEGKREREERESDALRCFALERCRRQANNGAGAAVPEQDQRAMEINKAEPAANALRRSKAGDGRGGREVSA